MPIARSDEEDAVILYHDTCHLLARLNMVDPAALDQLRTRIMEEGVRSDGMDRHALGLMAALVTMYLMDNEEDYRRGTT
jgi:hypothetical protein